MQNETTIRELSVEQLDAVGGGGASTEWGVATGVAVAFTAAAATVVGAPIVAGAFAAAGIASAGAAIYYAMSDDETKTAS